MRIGQNTSEDDDLQAFFFTYKKIIQVTVQLLLCMYVCMYVCVRVWRARASASAHTRSYMYMHADPSQLVQRHSQGKLARATART